jgi:Tol biopolymer transport system component
VASARHVTGSNSLAREHTADSAVGTGRLAGAYYDVQRHAAFVLVILVAACTTAEEPRRRAGEAARPALPEALMERPLVFTRADGTWVARADGSELRKVVDLSGVFEFQPDVSPDGSRVLLRVDDGGRSQGTWIVELEGTLRSSVRLTGPGRRISGGAADWAPDGRQFVVAGKRPGERFLGLYILDVSRPRLRPRRITPDRWEAQYPAWSPDGRLIAFTRVVPPSSFEIWVVAPDGTGVRRLTGDAGSDNYAAWSPDASALVYSSEDRPDRNGLWVMRPDGTGRRYLAEGGEPQWEPGDWIVFDCPVEDREAPGQACAVDPEDRSVVRLPLGREAVFPNWIPR